MMNKTTSVLTTTKIWSLVPEGLNTKTDWLIVSRKVNLILTPYICNLYIWESNDKFVPTLN